VEEDTMRKLLSIVVVTGALGMLPHPVPADAAQSKSCLQNAVDSCDRDFPGGDRYTVAIRGWCYLIRTALCKVLT
jgi:hypothetical protein